jgi:hypothetical protein
MALNAETATALGLTIPPSMYCAADCDNVWSGGSFCCPAVTSQQQRTMRRGGHRRYPLSGACRRRMIPALNATRLKVCHTTGWQCIPSLQKPLQWRSRRFAYSATMSSQFGHDVYFTCPYCGARYVVSFTKLPIADSGSEYCECCKRRMFQWNSALRPRYRLVERPERKHP